MDDINNTSQFTEKRINNKLREKVINLDTKRVRLMKMRMELNEKKSILTASILSIVAVVSFLNQKIVSQFETKKEGGRGIASVDDLNEEAKYHFEWQKDLANKLQNTRKPSSLGESANLIDSIRFGVLEGKYTLKIDNNTIQELEFMETATGDRPKYVQMDRFLKENTKAFFPQAVEFVPVKKETNGETKEEVFEARDSSNEAMGQILAKLDSYGRLISIKKLN